MRTANDLVFNATSVSGTTAYTSDPIPAESMFQFTVQVVTAGSNPNGTLKVQMSNDLPGTNVPTNFSDITSATVSTTNNGVYAIQKIDCCAQWLQVVYTNASGSGTVTARLKSNGY